MAPGTLATVQDLGRVGLRRSGVPTSGALDPAALRIANALVGNAQGAPAIEFFLVGPTLRASGGPVRVGIAGDVVVEVEAGGRVGRCRSWRTLMLCPGDVLRVRCGGGTRVGYLAVAGGLAVEPVMGSASTYLRARLGGLDGAPLRRGQRLPLRETCGYTGPELALPTPPPADPTPTVLAIPGPQDDHFTSRALETFFAAEFTVSRDSDRMGMRLEGPPLAHRPDLGPDIASDATVPGSVQVPGNGRPIVLLADCQTTGGYAKIATVASADLPRLARLPTGSRVRFRLGTPDEAEDLARASVAATTAQLASIAPLVRAPPAAALALEEGARARSPFLRSSNIRLKSA